MFEIELKAHVQDKKSLIDTLDSFADYLGDVKRDDTYYKFTRFDGMPLSLRIRQETPQAEENETNKKNVFKNRTILTYKRKELKTDSNGSTIEVNDERESLIDKKEPIEMLLLDTGYEIAFTKTKIVKVYEYDGATIEVCNVEKLGDFIEIEFLSWQNDEETVKNYQKRLKNILKKCNIDESAIESRYYSEMLKEAI